jgi:PhnB protein
MTVKAIPSGYHTLTPYMTVRDAARAIEFYKQAFGAVERGAMKGPDGNIMHAELLIGDSILMLADEQPQFGSLSPQSTGGPVGDMFWGDRYGKLADPFGHKWSIATHKADLSPEQMEEGMNAMMKQMPKSA